MLFSLPEQQMHSREGGKGRRRGEGSGWGNHLFLLDKKALTQLSRILGLTNVKPLVEVEYPLLILTKQETRNKARIEGLCTETVSESPQGCG